MNKFIKGFIIMAVTFTVINAPKADAKTISVKEAAQKIYDAEKKAYETKKDVTIKLQVKAKSAKKAYSIGKKISKEYAEIDKFFWGNYDEGTWSPDGFEYKKTIPIYYSHGLYHSLDFVEVGSHGSYDDFEWSEVYKFNKKKKVATYNVVFHSDDSVFRNGYEEIECRKKIALELREITKDMNDLDKAMAVADWICKRMVYGSHKGNNYVMMCNYDETGVPASGVCMALSHVYKDLAVAVGLNRVTYIRSGKLKHAWNGLEIDGKIYCIDLTRLVRDAGTPDDGHLNGDIKSVDDYRKLVEEYRVSADGEYSVQLAGLYDEYWSYLLKHENYLAGKMTKEDYDYQALGWYDETYIKAGTFVGYPWEISRAEYYIHPVDTFGTISNRRLDIANDWVWLEDYYSL